jgi:hypothetical protein
MSVVFVNDVFLFHRWVVLGIMPLKLKCCLVKKCLSRRFGILLHFNREGYEEEKTVR